MASDLINAAGSDYVSALNAFRPSAELPEVVIYVEGWDDVSFWTECVHKYFERFRFDIRPLRLSDGNIADGKGNLFANLPLSALGPRMIIAVDADYDWIIDNYRPSPTVASLSRQIRDNDYILHTYLYSTENYKCHADSLPVIISKATGVTPGPECKHYQSAFSEAVAPLFLIHLVSVDHVDGVYPIAAFVDDVDKINIDLTTLRPKPNSRRYINSRLQALAAYGEAHAQEVSAYEAKLASLGFDRAKYYMLFKGHCVADAMTRKRFQSLILKLRCGRMREIRAIPDEEQRERHMNNYCSVTGISEKNKHEEISARLEQLIIDCTYIRNAGEGYARLSRDLDRLFG